MQQINQALEHTLTDSTMAPKILIDSGSDSGSNPRQRHDVERFPIQVRGWILVGGSNNPALDELEKMDLQANVIVSSSVSAAAETGVDAIDDMFLRNGISQSVDGDIKPLGEKMVRADSRLDSMTSNSDNGSNVEVVAIENNVLLLVPQITQASQELECCPHMSRLIAVRDGHNNLEAAKHIIPRIRALSYLLSARYQGSARAYQNSTEFCRIKDEE